MGSVGETVTDLSQRLLAHHGGLRGLFRMDIAELARLRGEVSGFILHVDPTRGSSVPTKPAVKRVADFLVATPASSLDRAPPRRFGPSAPPPLLSTGFVHDIPIVIQNRLAYAMRDGCGSH